MTYIIAYIVAYKGVQELLRSMARQLLRLGNFGVHSATEALRGVSMRNLIFFTRRMSYNV